MTYYRYDPLSGRDVFNLASKIKNTDVCSACPIQRFIPGDENTGCCLTCLVDYLRQPLKMKSRWQMIRCNDDLTNLFYVYTHTDQDLPFAEWLKQEVPVEEET